MGPKTALKKAISIHEIQNLRDNLLGTSISFAAINLNSKNSQKKKEMIKSKSQKLKTDFCLDKCNTLNMYKHTPYCVNMHEKNTQTQLALIKESIKTDRFWEHWNIKETRNQS